MRRHVDTTALMVEGFSPLRLEEQFQRLLSDPAAPVKVDAVLFVFGGHVADGRDIVDPTATDDVEYRHVLRQADRLVEGQDDHRHGDGQRRRAGSHGRGQNHRRGQIAVAHPMVLAHNRGERSPGL